MITLIIAEKPSMGRAISDSIPGKKFNRDGYIEYSGGVISWCVGHILELADPGDYKQEWKRWNIQDLPIIPSQWKMKIKKRTAKQFNVLKALLKQADLVIHSGDPDREGQLLVDEVLLKLKNTKPVKRLVINDLNQKSIQTAMNNLKQNDEFQALYQSALVRTRADWLYGINMTRAYTILGKASGYKGVLSVGRVQTPVLGLVVARDLEIERFRPIPYYKIQGEFKAEKGSFSAELALPKDMTGLDAEGRLVDINIANQLIERLQGKSGEVSELKRQKRALPPPLPYSLSSLQIEASQRYGYSAQNVLDTCQTLYEKYKLITYPRSDCRYLPQDHYQQRKAILQSIEFNQPATAPFINNANTDIKTKVWNDKKITAHHAIIPAEKKTKIDTLEQKAKNIYMMIARNYIAQFYPPYEYSVTKVTVRVDQYNFLASSYQPLKIGWKALWKNREGTAGKPLPDLIEKEEVSVEALKRLDKITEPPRPFTDATLLKAMTGIANYVSDLKVKKLLRETDGLGTEATRAGIIELLIHRGFLVKDKKQIKSTATGRQLIHILPDAAKLPDMTAYWESVLAGIANGENKSQGFIKQLEQELQILTKNALAQESRPVW